MTDLGEWAEDLRVREFPPTFQSITSKDNPPRIPIHRSLRANPETLNDFAREEYAPAITYTNPGLTVSPKTQTNK